METLGNYFPNTPMLAAIVKVSGIMSDEQLLDDMKGSFKHKFAKKPEVIENITMNSNRLITNTIISSNRGTHSLRSILQLMVICWRLSLHLTFDKDFLLLDGD